MGAPWGHAACLASGLEFCGLSLVEVIRPRYVFFLNWSQRVPDAFLEKYECVNFHCTALPFGRGGHPIENLLLLGVTYTPITAHRMTSELDAGPVYAVSRPVSLAGTKTQIQERFIRPVANLMRYIAYHVPEPVPQHGKPTIFKRLSKDDYQKFWEARQ